MLTYNADTTNAAHTGYGFGASMNIWNHIAGTASVSSQRSLFVVNGNLISKQTSITSVTSPSTNIYFGDTTVTFTGSIRDMKLWNEYKPSGYIAANMHKTPNWVLESPTDIIVYVKFDEGAGSTYYDYSPANITSINAAASSSTYFWVADKSTSFMKICQNKLKYSYENQNCYGNFIFYIKRFKYCFWNIICY